METAGQRSASVADRSGAVLSAEMRKARVARPRAMGEAPPRLSPHPKIPLSEREEGAHVRRAFTEDNQSCTAAPVPNGHGLSLLMETRLASISSSPNVIEPVVGTWYATMS